MYPMEMEGFQNLKLTSATPSNFTLWDTSLSPAAEQIFSMESFQKYVNDRHTLELEYWQLRVKM